MSHGMREWYALLAVSLVGAVLSLVTGAVGPGLLVIAAYLLVRFAVGLVRGEFGVDLLMGSAALVTWYLGAFFEGYLIIALYALSEVIESLAERRALRTLSSLKELIPDSVTLITDRGVRPVPPDELGPGDVVLVRRGEAVVVDGVLLDDAGVFDTSIMTGEQEPVRVDRGGTVLSGYINLGDPVRVKALASFSDSALRLLVAEAVRALERKSRVQRFLERIAPPYTAALLGAYVAASIIIGPYNALPIILAGCPSAFIIASATLTAISIASLAKKGVVVRGGEVLERASGTKVVVLDKTGTVTTGKLSVASVIPVNGYSQEDVLRLAGAAGKGSIHPVSAALAPHSDLVPEAVKEFVGSGVEARVGGRLVRVGKKEFAGFDGAGCGELIAAYVSVDGEPAGIICLKEEVGEGVRNLVRELGRLGVGVVLASGDREEKVAAIAKELGISEYHYGMRPQDKAALVKEIRRRQGPVAVVGDGVNDAIALAEADLGAAVGKLNLTASVADAVLLPGAHALTELIRTAKRYRRAIVAAFITAATIKAASLLLGLSGNIPMAAVVALGDDGSTIVSLLTALVTMKAIKTR